MSIINVKREKIKNVMHLVTDYMYEGHNVGINLNVLNTIKTTRNLKIPCIPISYNTLSFNSSTSEISITSNLAPGVNDDITVTFNIKYPDRDVTEQIVIDDIIEDKTDEVEDTSEAPIPEREEIEENKEDNQE